MLFCVITIQRKHTGSVQVFSQASEALARAIGLCLQHGLHSSILAEASLNMLECHGQLDPAMTGQYLALYQVCTVAHHVFGACHSNSRVITEFSIDHSCFPLT